MEQLGCDLAFERWVKYGEEQKNRNILRMKDHRKSRGCQVTPQMQATVRNLYLEERSIMASDGKRKYFHFRRTLQLRQRRRNLGT